jgi:hypothetical protein
MSQPVKTPADALREAVARAQAVREAVQRESQAIKAGAEPVEPSGSTGA